MIGWAGRLEADRGGKDAIWAADLLKVIRDDAHLLIFGDGPHRDRLVLFRQQVEIADKVHFLGQRGDLQEFLPNLDQFWSTRRRPGMPQAVLEALAAGVPVVASDVPGTRELIEHEASGYLFAPGIAPAWPAGPSISSTIPTRPCRSAPRGESESRVSSARRRWSRGGKR